MERSQRRRYLAGICPIGAMKFYCQKGTWDTEIAGSHSRAPESSKFHTAEEILRSMVEDRASKR